MANSPRDLILLVALQVLRDFTRVELRGIAQRGTG